MTYRAGDVAVATFGPILITYVRGPIDLAYLAAAKQAGRSLGAATPGGIGSLTLIPAAMPIPEGRVREQASRDTKEANAWVAAGATVLGGEGFIASAKRSVLTAMTLFAGGPPRRVFDTSTGAIDWLGERLRAQRATLDPLREWSLRMMGDDYRELLRAG